MRGSDDLEKLLHFPGREQITFAGELCCFIFDFFEHGNYVSHGGPLLWEAGAVSALVAMVGERVRGLPEKAKAVIGSLVGVAEGKEAVVEEGGVEALVEAIGGGGSPKGKELAVSILLCLCCDDAQNRVLLVRQGGIPPLVALAQSGTATAMLKAEILLRLVREHRQEQNALFSFL